MDTLNSLRIRTYKELERPSLISDITVHGYKILFRLENDALIELPVTALSKAEIKELSNRPIKVYSTGGHLVFSEPPRH